jgi:hypothetical protein
VIGVKLDSMDSLGVALRRHVPERTILMFAPIPRSGRM